MSKLSRRQFIATSSAAAAVASGVVQAKGTTYPFERVSTEARLAPDMDKYSPPVRQPGTLLTLYAHISPDLYNEYASVSWEIATDSKFSNIVLSDSSKMLLESDTVLGLHIDGVPPGSELFYRFTCDNCYLNRTTDELDLELQQVLEDTGERIKNYSRELEVELKGEFLSMFRKHTVAKDQSVYA